MQEPMDLDEAEVSLQDLGHDDKLGRKGRLNRPSSESLDSTMVISYPLGPMRHSL